MSHEDLVTGEPDPFDPLTQQRAEEAVKTKREVDTKAARTELEVRQGAYRRVLVDGTPSRDDRDIVKADLKKFCRFNQTAYSDNDRVHCLLTGRQEVYLRIHDFVSMSVDELLEKYTGGYDAKGIG